MIAADEEEKGLFERNDEDVGMGVIHTDLEQPLEKLLGWNGEVIFPRETNFFPLLHLKCCRDPVTSTTLA